MRDIIYRPKADGTKEGLLPAIQQLQADTAERLKGRGRAPLFIAPLLSLQAEKWTVITVRVVPSGITREHTDERAVAAQALEIGRTDQPERHLGFPEGGLELVAAVPGV